MFSIWINNFHFGDSESGLTCYIGTADRKKEASFDTGNCLAFHKAMHAIGIRDGARFTMIITAMRLGVINADSWALFVQKMESQKKPLPPLNKGV